MVPHLDPGCINWVLAWCRVLCWGVSGVGDGAGEDLRFPEQGEVGWTVLR